MRLDTAFLAEYALAHADGTFYLIGGFLERLTVEATPTVRPHLSVVVRGAFEGDELGRKNVLSLEMVWSKSTPVASDLSVEFQPAEGKASQSLFQCIFAVRDVIIPDRGTLEFVVRHDGSEVARLPLTVNVGPTPEGLHDTEQAFVSPQIRLTLEGLAHQINVQTRRVGYLQKTQLAYAAFARGDLVQAATLFQELIDEDPTNPTPHNNLGFVLLGLRKPEEALKSLQTAASANYPDTPVLYVNLGCAYYDLGDFRSALAHFDRALHERRAAYPSQLWLIAGERRPVVYVDQAPVYVGLVATNAAWAAHRGGESATAWVKLAEASCAVLGDATPSRIELLESLRGLQTLGAG